MVEPSESSTNDLDSTPAKNVAPTGEKEPQPPTNVPKNPGIVYVLSNPAMDGYLKIGKTKGESPQDVIERMRQLDDTATPREFVCEYAAVVEDYERVERAKHTAFGENRVRPNREFFEGVPPFRANALLELLTLKNVTPDASETYGDPEAGRSGSTSRRPKFRISQARVPKGERLHWADNREKWCTVTSNDRVVYEGQEHSISGLTANLKGWRISHAPNQGQYWLYEGQSLQERRDQFDAEENGVE